MAKTTKKPAKHKKRGKYEEKVLVKGGFLNIMKASMKDADSKSPKKKD